MVDACSVYQLSFPNGKQYIGVSSDPRGRLCSHFRGKAIVGRAIRKHGTPELKVLLIADREYCYEMERLLIGAKNTLHPDGYNMDSGGRGVVKPSKATLLKMSQAQIGKKHTEETKKKLAVISLKENLSEETRKKMSVANRGRIRSAATRLKMSRAQKGRVNSAAARLKMSDAKKGKKLTEDHKQKIRKANIGRKVSVATRLKISKALRGHVHSAFARYKMSISQCVRYARKREQDG